MNMKPLKFIGSSLDDIRNFPDEARRAAGFADATGLCGWPRIVIPAKKLRE
jgi:hypothetical protein